MNCPQCKNPISDNATRCEWCGVSISSSVTDVGTQNSNTGTVKINTSFLPLALAWNLCSPVIEINGEKNRTSWGETQHNLPLGKYKVTIYIPYLTFRRCGENSVEFELKDGQLIHINYKAPLTVLSSGKISTQ